MSEFSKEIDKKNIIKLRELLNDMPYFCTTFFQGIDGSTSERTRVGYCRNIYTFFQFITLRNPLYRDYAIKDLPLDVLEQLTSSDIDEFKDYLKIYTVDGIQYSNSAPTIARYLSAISSMYKFFNMRDMVKNDPLRAVNRPKLEEKEIIALDQNQIIALMESVNNTENMGKQKLTLHQKTVERDKAILAVFLGTGIRVSELVGLDLDDIDFNNQSLHIYRKGKKEQFVYFGEDVLEALLDYMAADQADDEIKALSPRDRLIKDNPDEKALFISLRGSRMAVRSVEVMVKKYSQLIQTNKKITPHKLRSSYGTALYRETGDIYLVADVLGHKDVNTTKAHYSAQSDSNRRRAAHVVSLKNSKKST